MLLKDWLKKEKITPYRLSTHILKCANATITDYLKGRRNLSKKYAVRIEKVTNGEVSRSEVLWPEDFVEKKGKMEQMSFLSKRDE